MKIDPKVLQQLFQTYGVSAVPQAGIQGIIKDSGKTEAKYEPILTGNDYVWSDSESAYVKGDERIYFYVPKGLFLWVWDNSLMRLLKGTDMLTKWVQGDEKYPEGKANSFESTYLGMTGEGGGGIAVAEPGEEEPEADDDDRLKGATAGPLHFTGIGQRPDDFEPKKVDPTDTIIAKLKKLAGKSFSLPSDIMIQYGLQAKKDNNTKLLKFLSQYRPMGENVAKKSQLESLVREIVRTVTKEAYEWDRPKREQPYEEKWVEDLANKIWPDPMDIGRGGDRWVLLKSKRAKTGEKVYMLSNAQEVTHTRFLINRGTKWYYLDVKPDHTKKWVEVPASEVPVPDHNPADDEDLQEDGGAGGGAVASGGGPVGMSTTTNVSPVTTPYAFGKKKKTKEGVHGRFDSCDWSELAVDPLLKSVCCGAPSLGNVDHKAKPPVGICSKCRNHTTFEKDEESINEINTTDGGTPGYQVPGCWAAEGGSKAGVQGSRKLGYELTEIGREDMKIKRDRLYESVKNMKKTLKKMLGK